MTFEKYKELLTEHAQTSELYFYWMDLWIRVSDLSIDSALPYEDKLSKDCAKKDEVNLTLFAVSCRQAGKFAEKHMTELKERMEELQKLIETPEAKEVRTREWARVYELNRELLDRSIKRINGSGFTKEDFQRIEANEDVPPDGVNLEADTDDIPFFSTSEDPDCDISRGESLYSEPIDYVSLGMGI